MIRALSSFIGLAIASAALAQPGYNYSNGHYYEIVLSSGITWDQANTAAAQRTFAGIHGHLATITSAGEQSGMLIATRNAGLAGLWIDGMQAAGGAEPGGGWGWASGETMSYTHWLGGEPNDFRGYFQGLNEDRMICWTSDGLWADAAAALNTNVVRGYLVEYDRAFRPIGNPATAHAFARVDGDGGLTWNQAQDAAHAMTYHSQVGQLAAITSADDQAFIVRNLGARKGLWLGGVQTDGAAEPAGGWTWANGDPWQYTHWLNGEPNDQRSFFDGTNENRLVFWDSAGNWNDLAMTDNRPADANGYIVSFAICPADYNEDGVTDFFDYLDFVDAFASADLAADFNGDGTLDFFDYLDFVDAFASGC